MSIARFSTALLVAFPGAAIAQGSSAVPRAQYITVQDGEFRKMDADKNGQVTKAEVEAFQRISAMATARQRNQQLFVQLDKDRNGQLSPAEFAAVVTGTPPANGAPFVTQMDGNRDGQVSLIEHRAGKLAYFDKIDLDKDGVVSVAELKSAGIVK